MMCLLQWLFFFCCLSLWLSVCVGLNVIVAAVNCCLLFFRSLNFLVMVFIFLFQVVVVFRCFCFSIAFVTLIKRIFRHWPRRGRSPIEYRTNLPAARLPININPKQLKQGTGTADHKLSLGCYKDAPVAEVSTWSSPRGRMWERNTQSLWAAGQTRLWIWYRIKERDEEKREQRTSAVLHLRRSNLNQDSRSS